VESKRLEAYVPSDPFSRLGIFLAGYCDFSNENVFYLFLLERYVRSAHMVLGILLSGTRDDLESVYISVVVYFSMQSEFGLS
jgi:hypothetical protein